MKKAVAMLVPAAFFALAIYGIISGINPMVAQENNNRFHALLLGCTYIGKPKDFDNVLYFDCADKIELHKEIDWTASIKK
jgi:hypothetical protein